MIRLLYFCVLALLFGCGTLEPSAPYERINPPPVYRQWWDSVWTHCGSQVRSSPDKTFDQVTFYRVESDYGFYIDLTFAAGAYTNGRAYIGRLYLDVPWVVKHEMLHAQLTEHVGHPPIFRECHLMADQQ